MIRRDDQDEGFRINCSDVAQWEEDAGHGSPAHGLFNQEAVSFRLIPDGKEPPVAVSDNCQNSLPGDDLTDTIERMFEHRSFANK
ncbi:MAG: hypothetical protein Kow001_05890 [Acidobacteriota bacterium]